MTSIRMIALCLVLLAAICVYAVPAIAEEHHHVGDWASGISDGAAAVIEPEPDEIEPVHLAPFTAGLFNGDWGIEFWNLPNPDLESVRVLFTSAPAGLALYHEGELLLGSDGTSTGQGYFEMAWPDPAVHHAHIDAYTATPGTYTVSFKLVSAVANNGSHTPVGDSGVYSVDFVTVPEPSSLLALAMPIAAVVIRRRK